MRIEGFDAVMGTFLKIYKFFLIFLYFLQEL